MILSLGTFSFGAVSLVKNADIDKCKYSEHGIGFDVTGTFSSSNGGFGKNVIISGVDMSSSIHTDDKKNDILTLSEGLTQELDDTTLTTEKKNSINFTEMEWNFI